jgi:hypothetical protein
VVGADGVTILTWVVDDKAPVAPVTVTVRGVESSPAVRIAVATPAEFVVAPVTWSAPELALNVTGTPASTLLAPSRANADTVALVDPSLKIVAALLLRVSELTAVVVAEDVAATCT